MAAFFWLVVVFSFVVLWPFKASSYFNFCLFFLLSLPPQMQPKQPPHMFRRGRVPSPMSPPPSEPTFGWLLCLLAKRRPPKAKTSPPSLFFGGLHCNAPNKGTNDSERKPDGSRPAQGVGERRHHDLVAPLAYPGRERAEAAGG